MRGTPFIGAGTPYFPGPGGNLGAFIAWDATYRQEGVGDQGAVPHWSGALVTAGDVAFYGTLDGWFKSVDAKTGKLLFEVQGGLRRRRQPDHLPRPRRQAVRGRLRGHRRRLVPARGRRPLGRPCRRAAPVGPRRTSDGTPARVASSGSSGSKGERTHIHANHQTRHRAARGQSRRRAGLVLRGGRPSAQAHGGHGQGYRPDPRRRRPPGRQRAQRTAAVHPQPGRGRQPVRPDELRRLSRRRCRRLGWAQPGRWPLALRRRGRRDLYFHFLRTAEGNAGVRRGHRHRRRVDAGGLHQGAGGAGRRADDFLVARRQRRRRSACGGP